MKLLKNILLSALLGAFCFPQLRANPGYLSPVTETVSLSDEVALRTLLTTAHLIEVPSNRMHIYEIPGTALLIKFSLLSDTEEVRINKYVACQGKGDALFASYRVLRHAPVRLGQTTHYCEKAVVQEKTKPSHESIAEILKSADLSEDQKFLQSKEILQAWVSLTRKLFDAGFMDVSFVTAQTELKPYYLFNVGKNAKGDLVHHDMSHLVPVSAHEEIPPLARLKLIQTFETWINELTRDRAIKLDLSRYFRKVILPQLAYIFEKNHETALTDFMPSVPESLFSTRQIQGMTQEQIVERAALSILKSKKGVQLFKLTAWDLLVEIVDLFEKRRDDLISLVPKNEEEHSSLLAIEGLLPVLRGLQTEAGEKMKLGHKGIYSKGIEGVMRRLTKSETHIHISGSISPELAFKLYWKFPQARRDFLLKNKIVSPESMSGAADWDWDNQFASHFGLNLIPRESHAFYSKLLETEGAEIGKERFENNLHNLFSNAEHLPRAIEIMKQKHIEFRPQNEMSSKERMDTYLDMLSTGEILLRQGEYANQIASKMNALEAYNNDSVIQFEMRTTAGNRPGSKLPMEGEVSAMIQGLKEAEEETGNQLKTGLILAVHKQPQSLLGKERMEALEREAREMSWDEVRSRFLQEKLSQDDWDELNTMSQRLRWYADEKMRIQHFYVLLHARIEATRRFQGIVDLKGKWLREDPEKARFLVGIDTVGSEIEYLNWTHKEGMKLAKSHGFKVTVHSGEVWDEGNETIVDALLRLRNEIQTGCVDRIGHATALGVNPFQLDYDDETVTYVAELQYQIFKEILDKHIHVESMPSSNLILNPNIQEYGSHVIHSFLAFGISTQLAQDNRWILHTRNLFGELTKILLGTPTLTFGQLIQVLQAGFEGSFLPETRRPRTELAEAA